MISAGESNGESHFRQKTTFAVKCLNLIAKVTAKVKNESGESNMSKCLKSFKSKAKVFPLVN